MKTRRRILFENKELGLRIYLNKNERFEILLNRINLTTFFVRDEKEEDENEFVEIIIRPNGLVAELPSGRKMVFLFNKLNWFVTPEGYLTFEKAFLFGDVEASLNGELLKNYSIN